MPVCRAVRRATCFHTHEAELAAANESGEGPSSLCQACTQAVVSVYLSFGLLLRFLHPVDLAAADHTVVVKLTQLSSLLLWDMSGSFAGMTQCMPCPWLLFACMLTLQHGVLKCLANRECACNTLCF